MLDKLKFLSIIKLNFCEMRRGDSATTRDELLMTPLYEGTAAPPSRKSPTQFLFKIFNKIIQFIIIISLSIKYHKNPNSIKKYLDIFSAKIHAE